MISRCNIKRIDNDLRLLGGKKFFPNRRKNNCFNRNLAVENIKKNCPASKLFKTYISPRRVYTSQLKKHCSPLRAQLNGVHCHGYVLSSHLSLARFCPNNARVAKIVGRRRQRSRTFGELTLVFLQSTQ